MRDLFGFRDFDKHWLKATPIRVIGIKLEIHVAMLRDFQIFEDFMLSDSFRNLSQKEQEEFVISYNNLLEEEMDVVLQETKQLLQQKSISDLFWQIYGHLMSNQSERKMTNGSKLLDSGHLNC
jgi:hypothetical protein